MPRLLTLADAIRTASDVRQAGRVVVTTNGAFDLLSVPHIRLLEAAKKEGDFLLVGINSDVSVKKLKGEKRPIIPEAERAELVAALRCVDGVFLFDDLDPREWLTQVRPNVHVNSAEYSEECIEAPVLKEIGAKLVLVPRHEDLLSTSGVIDVIRSRFS